MITLHAPQLVFIASPWQLHVTHALYCIQHGCHVALEIKGGLYLHEYQPLIEAAEAGKKKIFPLENTLFRQEILAMHNLVSAGELGEVVYMRGGYRHDLRNLLLDDQGNLGNRKKTESIWRSKFYQQENGDLYPTHGLAPLCLIAGIPRKDRFVRLTTFSSKPAGLYQRIRELGGNPHVPVTQGDVTVTQLETASGTLVSLTHDTTLPRPRSLDFEIQGTKGIWQGEQRRIYLEGKSPHETWETDTAYLQKYEHLYWQQWGEEALRIDTHHEGMDYIMLKALEAEMKQEIPYPADIHDLAPLDFGYPSVHTIRGRTTHRTDGVSHPGLFQIQIIVMYQRFLPVLSHLESASAESADTRPTPICRPCSSITRTRSSFSKSPTTRVTPTGRMLVAFTPLTASTA